jgi:hypothetical protein
VPCWSLSDIQSHAKLHVHKPLSSSHCDKLQPEPDSSMTKPHTKAHALTKPGGHQAGSLFRLITPEITTAGSSHATISHAGSSIHSRYHPCSVLDQRVPSCCANCVRVMRTKKQGCTTSPVNKRLERRMGVGSECHGRKKVQQDQAM